MAGLPISLSECLTLVQEGYKLYTKIKHDVPDQIADVAERIESLAKYLKRLEKFLNQNSLLVKSHPEERTNLQEILSKTKDNIGKIVEILDEWKTGSAPFGLQFRWKFGSQVYFTLSGKPVELEELGKKLDRRQDEIRDWQAMLTTGGTAQILAILMKPNRSPSPNPHPSERPVYNLLFVDFDNDGRSVLAEAYALLFREWTVRSGGKWGINYIHSAGIGVKSRSDTVSLQQQLGMEMYDGNKHPLDIAVSALFDKLPFTYAYKDDIRKTVMQRRSRGLTQNLFSVYDFIIVFNRHNLAGLEDLRDAITKKKGHAPPSAKGKLVLLGGYGDSGYQEIWNPKRKPDGSHSYENWVKTASNIQTSLKRFMKRELGWTEPQPGAHQDT